MINNFYKCILIEYNCIYLLDFFIEIYIMLCNNISKLSGGVFDDEKTNDDICCNCYGFYGCKL